MFHIVFNANESHIKYLAVLCYSIIFHSRQSDKNQEGYHFHLLTDGLAPKTQAKLFDLENQLSEIYPCKISFYVLSDEEFQGFPKQNGNYLTYFRLKISKILPQEIQKCLYLDVDMLCLSDIREIFSMDLGGRVCGVVKDAHYRPSRIMLPIKESSRGGGFALRIESYFNAGFILIDLQEWRNQQIEERCFEFLKNYIPEWHDQDTLNAILGDQVCMLPLEWNFMEGHFLQDWALFKGEGEGEYMLTYTQEEYLRAKEEVKIVHFVASKKPWHRANFIGASYRSQWWEFALQTPVFAQELQMLYFKVFEEMLIELGTLIKNQGVAMQILIVMKKIKRKITRIFQGFK